MGWRIPFFGGFGLGQAGDRLRPFVIAAGEASLKWLLSWL
jgi:hypothetical protein